MDENEVAGIHSKVRQSDSLARRGRYRSGRQTFWEISTAIYLVALGVHKVFDIHGVSSIIIEREIQWESIIDGVDLGNRKWAANDRPMKRPHSEVRAEHARLLKPVSNTTPRIILERIPALDHTSLERSVQNDQACVWGFLQSPCPDIGSIPCAQQ